MSTMQKPVVRLVGEDGNAFAIMGRWSAAARAEGWSSEEIRAVLDEAMAGDYDHLLLTIRANSDQTGVEWDEPEDVTREREASAEALADEYASHDEPPYGSFPEER